MPSRVTRWKLNFLAGKQTGLATVIALDQQIRWNDGQGREIR